MSFAQKGKGLLSPQQTTKILEYFIQIEKNTINRKKIPWTVRVTTLISDYAFSSKSHGIYSIKLASMGVNLCHIIYVKLVTYPKKEKIPLKSS